MITTKSFKLLMTFSSKDTNLLSMLRKAHEQYNANNNMTLTLQQFILKLLKDTLMKGK